MAVSLYKTYRTYVNPPNDGRDFRTFYDDINARTLATRDSVLHLMDLPYGADPKQRLDIYFPAGEVKNAPVLVYFHGGGFFEGDCADYGFLASPWTAQGVIMVLASYRLCSDGFTKLDAVADGKLAMKWVYENIARYGGDPMRLVMSGNSAGAIMTGNAVNDISWMADYGMDERAIIGAAMISGIYNFPLDYNHRPDTLPDDKTKIAMSAMQHIGKVPPKMLVVAGSLETGIDNYVTSSKAFVEELQRLTPAEVTYMIIPDKDHLGMHFVPADESLPLFPAMKALFD